MLEINQHGTVARFDVFEKRAISRVISKKPSPDVVTVNTAVAIVSTRAV